MKYSLEDSYKQKVINCCKDTTSHGIPRAFKSNNWFKSILWMLCFFLSFGYMIYSIINLFIAYYTFSVTASITRIHELPVTFPAVTLCNINPYNEQYSTQYIKEVMKNAECFYLNDIIAFEKCYNTTNTNQAFDSFIDQLKRITANDNRLTDAIRQYLGYDMRMDMLVSCDFNGIECSARDFHKFWSYEYGNCYTFNQYNITKPLKTSIAGNNYGLKLELVVSK